jgi:2',3'-cyclic-nucleotide 2'-phosphodiesterase (5'-nucleotidase family)
MPFRNEKGELVGGAAARAALLERERDRTPHSLTLDAGDVFQGTPFFNFFHGVPDYRALKMMKYDAGVIGNHDLDEGPRAWLAAANINILSANVFASRDSGWTRVYGEPPPEVRKRAKWIGGGTVPDSLPLDYLANPRVLHLPVGEADVALLGLTTADITHIVSPRYNAGVAVGDPVAVARWEIPYLRHQPYAKANPDLVICISHLGFEADKELARRVSGIDVIVGGHSHTKLTKPILIPNGTPNGYHGTLIVQAGAYGEYLGRLAIYLDKGRPVGYSGRLIPVRPADGEDPDVVALLKPYADSIGGSMSQVVFHSAARIPSSGVRDGETPLGNFVADAMREAVDADIALINSGGIRSPIPQGDVTVGDVYSTLPFENSIVVVPMPGWQVRELCDIAGRRIGKGGFLQVSGISFAIKGQRSGNVRVGGQLIDSDRTYRVATVDYLYDGGDGYTIFKKTASAEQTGVLLRDAAIQFLTAHPDYEFRKEGRIVWEGSMRGF